MTNRDVEEKLRKLAAIDGKDADLDWLFYISGEGKERQDADDLFDIFLFQKANKDFKEEIFLDPASADKCFGEYFLGSVIYPTNRAYAPFGLREDEWIKHMLITGMTGAGKTNLVFQILKEFRRKNKPFMIFDWKRNYRDLLQKPEFRGMKVFTVAQKTAPFRFNPLIPPPGVEPGHWLMKLVDVIDHAYFGGLGVENVLREAIDSVYEKCGFFDGTRKQTPTFYMVRQRLAERQLYARMALWKASAMRALDSLCFRHGLGPVVNTSLEWDYKQLLSKPVILELDALPNDDKVFLTEAMILWLYEFRKREGKRERFKHALLIEEGHHILSREKEKKAGGETIMETCLRQIREFGEAVVVIDQQPTELSNAIKANTYTKITFNLGNGKDILEMSSCMGLDKEESEYVNLLEVGHSVVSLKGRVFAPLHVSFPKVDVKKGVVLDADLKAGNVVQDGDVSG